MMERVNETTGLNQENQLVFNGTRVRQFTFQNKAKTRCIENNTKSGRKTICGYGCHAHL